MSASLSIDHPSGIEIVVTPERDRVVVAPHGDLGARAAAAVEQEVRSLVGRGFGDIVLDTRGLFFVDSHGLDLLARLEAAAIEGGYRLSVRAGTGAATRPVRARRRFERTPLERSL